MNKVFDKDTGKKTWELTHWGDKTLYVLGYINVIMWAIYVVVLIVLALAVSINGSEIPTTSPTYELRTN